MDVAGGLVPGQRGYLKREIKHDVSGRESVPMPGLFVERQDDVRKRGENTAAGNDAANNCWSSGSVPAVTESFYECFFHKSDVHG